MEFHGTDLGDCSPHLLTKILQKEAADYGCTLKLSAIAGKQSPDVAIVRFQPGEEIIFEVCTEFHDLERLQWFSKHWLSSWPMFSEVKKLYPDITGYVSLNLDDRPHHPGLAFCGNNASNVLIPDPAFTISYGYKWLRGHLNEHWVPWHDRHDTLFWRGSSTGARTWLRIATWQEMPRFKLCLLAKKWGDPKNYDIGITNIVQINDVNERARIQEAKIIAEKIPIKDFMKYKFLIDIDGNTSAWEGLFSKLLMGCCVFKVDSFNGFRQWYYDDLIPWKNFIPVSEGMNEIPELLKWARANPIAVREIGAEAYRLAKGITFASATDKAARQIARCVIK